MIPKTFHSLLKFLLALIFLARTDAHSQCGQIVPPYYHSFTQGFNGKLRLTNYGLIDGVGNYSPGTTIESLGFQYPEDSFFEHIDVMAIRVGALVDTGTPGRPKIAKIVSSTDLVGNKKVFCPTTEYTMFSPVDHEQPWRFVSTQNPHDSDAISESDYIFEYADTLPPALNEYEHHPLGIKIIQRSMAWAQAIREPIFPLEYAFVNIGTKPLLSAYISFPIIPFIGLPGTPRFRVQNNVTGYWPEVQTAYVYNLFDLESGATPIAFTVLRTPQTITSTHYRFRWFKGYGEDNPFGLDSNRQLTDAILYDFMSGARYPGEPAIRPNQDPANAGFMPLMFSFGPIDTWAVGETLHVTLAVIGGRAVEFGYDNIRDNARFAQTLYNRDYHPPVVLPAPRLRVEFGNKRASLSWSASDAKVNPMELWDNYNSVATVYPPDHWRRKNPPPGTTSGGRVFEGYRLYRSEDPAGTASSFTLLKQWDLIDSVGPRFGYDTGLDSAYVDSNLQTGKTYWYAVTSFGIPDVHTIDYLDFDGQVKQETLFTPSAETSVLASRKRANLPFSVATANNQVLVVPNPYRVDENYTLENGGWEGRGRTWTENKRLIRFIHLPPKCMIRIYSVAGDVIATLYHDDPTRGELDWNLVSESNRALASGLYVFSVESDFGRQIGKFVLIR